jgi:hypothetical protein
MQHITGGSTLPVRVNLKLNIGAPEKVGVSRIKGIKEVNPKLNVGGVLRKVGTSGMLVDEGASEKNAVFKAGESRCSWDAYSPWWTSHQA